MLYGEEEFNEALENYIRRDKKHVTYEECVAHADEMSIHIYGTKPTNLFDITRPREDAAIKKYREDAFQPITKASGNKAISVLNKIFNPISYSIVFNPEAGERGEEFKEYTNESFMDYNSVVAFVREVLTKKMIADPNGIVAVRPQRVYKEEAKRIKPIVKVFGSKNIISEDDEHYLVLVRIEGEGSSKVHFFEYYDAKKWISFSTQYKRSKVNVTILSQYDWDLDEEAGIPAWKLRGISEANDNGEIVFKSFFDPALAFWNNAIIHEDDLKGAFIQHMHPIKYESGTTCTYVYKDQKCRGGRIKFPDGEEDVCPGCNGSGMKPLNSPYGTHVIPENKLSGPNAFLPLGFVTVPTEATELLDRRVDKQQDKGMWALNMDITDKIGEDQSGVAKTIDRSELFNFLTAVAETVFDIHIKNIYYYCALLAYGEDGDIEKIIPQVNKPVNFDVNSNAEEVNNFKAAKDSGLDKNYLLVKQMDIQNKEFMNNPKLTEIMNTILLVDPLAGFSSDEVSLYNGQRLVSKTDVVIHAYIKPFVERAFEEHTDFGSMKRPAQYKILEAYAKEKEKAMELQLSKEMEDAIPPDDKSKKK